MFAGLRRGELGALARGGRRPGHRCDPGGALKAWGWTEEPNPRAAGPRTIWVKGTEAALEPLGLHECRQTFASLMIASGVNAKALCSHMVHATVAITFDT